MCLPVGWGQSVTQFVGTQGVDSIKQGETDCHKLDEQPGLQIADGMPIHYARSDPISAAALISYFEEFHRK
jgi:hypothetical protein